MPTEYIERYGLAAVVPILTALLLSSLNDFQFCFMFLYAILEFSWAQHYSKCTSRHRFPYGGLGTNSFSRFGTSLAVQQIELKANKESIKP